MINNKDYKHRRVKSGRILSVQFILKAIGLAWQTKVPILIKIMDKVEVNIYELSQLSLKPRKDTYPLVCLKGYPSDRGRIMEFLIGGEFLSYPSLIGQLKIGYPFRHP